MHSICLPYPPSGLHIEFNLVLIERFLNRTAMKNSPKIQLSCYLIYIVYNPAKTFFTNNFVTHSYVSFCQTSVDHSATTIALSRRTSFHFIYHIVLRVFLNPFFSAYDQSDNLDATCKNSPIFETNRRKVVLL